MKGLPSLRVRAQMSKNEASTTGVCRKADLEARARKTTLKTMAVATRMRSCRCGPQRGAGNGLEIGLEADLDLFF